MSKPIRNVQPIKNTAKQKISVIILAAGMTSGGKYLGNKSLLPLTNKKTILETQIEAINKAFPNIEIVLVSGFEGDRVMNHCGNNVICVENERYKETNTTRSLGMGLRAATSDKVVVIYGDVVFNHIALNKLDTSSSTVLYNDTLDHPSVGCVINKEGKLENLMYGVGQEWIQIFSLVGRELEQMRGIAWDRRNEKLLGFEAINKVVSNGGKFSCLCNKHIVALDVDDIQDFKKAKKIIL